MSYDYAAMCHVDHTYYNEDYVYICLLLARSHGFPQDVEPSIFRRNRLRSVLKGLIRVKRSVTRKGTNDNQCRPKDPAFNAASCFSAGGNSQKPGYIRAKTKQRSPKEASQQKKSEERLNAQCALRTSSSKPVLRDGRVLAVPDTRSIPFLHPSFDSRDPETPNQPSKAHPQVPCCVKHR